jgi:predicted dehydrogenase
MRFGMIGTGAMAHTMMRAFELMPGVEVTAVASRSARRAAEFARDHRISQHFESIDALTATADIDIVYIASHPNHHVEDCLSALEASRPVLCEKPLSTSVQGAEQVAEAASRRGVFLMEGMWLRFLPAVLHAERLARDRVAGVPRMFEATFGYPVAVGGGSQGTDVGVLLDRAVYPISLAIQLFGVPKESTAVVQRDETGMARSGCFTLRHEGEALSQLTVSSTALLGNRALICCDHGRIELAEPLLGAEHVHVRMQTPQTPASVAEGSPSARRRAIEALKSSALLRRLRASARRERTDYESYGANPYIPQLEEAVRCVRARETQSSLMPIEHSIETLRIIERAQPAESGQRK